MKVGGDMSPSGGQSGQQQPESEMDSACGRARVWGMYLLQEGELLGNVVSTVFILAKREVLNIC